MDIMCRPWVTGRGIAIWWYSPPRTALRLFYLFRRAVLGPHAGQRSKELA